MNGESAPVSLRTVSERQGLSLKFTETIAGELRKSGLIESSRGKEGGYRIALAPKEISVGSILRSVEQSLSPVSCTDPNSGECSRASECLTMNMWHEFDSLTSSYFDSVTLHDLVTGERWSNK